MLLPLGKLLSSNRSRSLSPHLYLKTPCCGAISTRQRLPRGLSVYCLAYSLKQFNDLTNRIVALYRHESFGWYCGGDIVHG